MLDRRRAFNLGPPGFIYHAPKKGFTALIAPEDRGFVEYIPNDVFHVMSYKVYTTRDLTEKELVVLYSRLDRLHAYNCGAAVTFRSQVKDLLKKNLDDYNPGRVVTEIQKLYETHTTDLKRFAEIQHIEPDQLALDDQLLWEAQMDGRTS